MFVISIRNDIEQDFKFPIGFDNGIRLKDILESEVDEKYYISQEKCDKLIQQFMDKGQDFSYCIDANYWKGTTPEQYLEKSRRWLVTVPNILRPVRTEYGKESIPCIIPDRVEKRQNGRRFKEDGEPMFTLISHDRHGILQIDGENEIKQIGMLDIKGNESIRRVYDERGISPSLTTMQGGNRQPKVLTIGKINSSQDGVVVSAERISPTHTSGHGNTPKVMVKEATKKGYEIAYEGDSINLEQPNSKT